MTVFLEDLFNIEFGADRYFGQVQHHGRAFNAILCGPFEKLMSLVHTEVLAEYELKEVTSVETNLPKDDSFSGFFPIDEVHVVVDGTVHNEHVVDENLSYFDVYIQNGCDFLCILSDDLPNKPQLDSRIRITGRCLIVYPKLNESGNSSTDI